MSIYKKAEYIHDYVNIENGIRNIDNIDYFKSYIIDMLTLLPGVRISFKATDLLLNRYEELKFFCERRGYSCEKRSAFLDDVGIDVNHSYDYNEHIYIDIFNKGDKKLHDSDITLLSIVDKKILMYLELRRVRDITIDMYIFIMKRKIDLLKAVAKGKGLKHRGVHKYLIDEITILNEIDCIFHDIYDDHIKRTDIHRRIDHEKT